MAYELKVWRGRDGTERIYLNGTTRSSIHLVRGPDGQIRWSSDGSKQKGPRKSAYYAKQKKDEAAVDEVCEAFGLRFGVAGEFDRAIAVALENRDPEADGEDDACQA